MTVVRDAHACAGLWDSLNSTTAVASHDCSFSGSRIRVCVYSILTRSRTEKDAEVLN